MSVAQKEHVCDRVSVQMYEATKRLREVHSQWINSGSQDIPPVKLWDIIEEIVELNDTGHPTFLGQNFTLAIDKLLKAKQAFDEEDTVSPSDLFWREIGGLFYELDVFDRIITTPVVVESMQMLAKNEVPYEQIAEIYGLVGANGIPQRHKVDQELRQPGSVIPDNWVHPRELDRQKRQKAFNKALDAFYNDEMESEAEETFKPCHESWLELYQQDVDVRQAAEMKGVTIADAQKEYESLAKFAKNKNQEVKKTFEIPEEIPVVEDEESTAEIEGDDPIVARLNTMTAKELKEYATSLGIAFNSEIAPKNLIKRVTKFLQEQEAVQ